MKTYEQFRLNRVVVSVFDFWTSQQIRLPRLSELALHIFAIPTSFAEEICFPVIYREENQSALRRLGVARFNKAMDRNHEKETSLDRMSPNDQAVFTKYTLCPMLVLDYYAYNASSRMTICLVELDDGRPCGEKFAGKYSAILCEHVQKQHPWVNVETVKVEKDRPGIEMLSVIPKDTIDNENYPLEHPRQQKINQLLTEFLKVANISVESVESDEFREIMSAMDSKYVLPSGSAMEENLEDSESKRKTKIFSFIAEQEQLSAICVYIWPKEGAQQFQKFYEHNFYELSVWLLFQF